MNHDAARRPWRRVAWVGVLAVSLFASWRIVTLSVADFLADTDPQRALTWRHDHPPALLRLAEERLTQGRLEESEQLARRALAANPLDGRAYRVLGNLAGIRGDRERQYAMMELAARHAPRDVATRAWAAQIAIERHDAASAVRHYDRMMRVAPERQPAVFPILMGLAAIPEGREALVRTLATHPPWRAEFLRDSAAKLSDTGTLTALFGELRSTAGLSPAESADFLGRLVKDRLWDQAFIAWTGGLSPEQIASLTAPMDGGFEQLSPASGPFDWQIQRRPGVDAGVQLLPDGPGRALRVEFAGQRSEFRDVRQLLLLPPGRDYQLQWRSRFDGLDTARGLHWTVSCAEGPSGKILATPPEMGARPWHESSAAFDVPMGCPAQWLALELDARIPAETEARGTAWFDDVRVRSPSGANPDGREP